MKPVRWLTGILAIIAAFEANALVAQDVSAAAKRPPTRAEIRAEVTRQQRLYRDVRLEPVASSMDICRSSPMPSGWIRVGGRWDPTQCGNPIDITENVWRVTRYNNKTVGSRMEVCWRQTIPPGWVIVSQRWDPTNCDRPVDIVHNKIRIRRVQ
jgi:hypothetical protein